MDFAIRSFFLFERGGLGAVEIYPANALPIPIFSSFCFAFIGYPGYCLQPVIAGPLLREDSARTFRLLDGGLLLLLALFVSQWMLVCW